MVKENIMDKTFILVGRVFAYVTSAIYFLTIFLIPLGVLNIVAGNKLGKAAEGELTTEEVQGWAIYLIFTTVIGGIFALLGINDATIAIQSNKVSVEDQLRELKKLFDDGLITEQEHEERREKIISKL